MPTPRSTSQYRWDTAGQVAAFLADAEAPDGTRPSVRTPGQLGPDGTMIRRDGFYFTVAEGVELPTGVGEMTDPDGGYAVMWGAGRYVLTPPSVPAEGPYAVAGGARAARLVV